MHASSFASLLRAPDLVRAFGPESKEISLEAGPNLEWSGQDSTIQCAPEDVTLKVFVSSPAQVSWVQLRWRADLRALKRFLGDHWERSYGDLEWRGEVPNRAMPWYFMASDGQRTHGYGVLTGANAFCFWTADAEGISLWIDLRCGGLPADLSDRRLLAATIVCREGKEGESPFQATQAFCKRLCSNPLLPDHAIYGTNDWNYAFGRSSAELIAQVSELISDLSPNQDNRPYSLIDEGWAMGPYENRFGFGPWIGNPNFGDMGDFAHRLRGLGVRPGLWYRPLTPLPGSKESWQLSRNTGVLDPTVPEVAEQVTEHIKRFCGWGYEMIKHDFTSWDLFGAWGFQMKPNITRDGWKFHDAKKTSAEVVKDLYEVIRKAAGSARLIGCNTFGHLASGTHEIQRIGDDTASTWNRNRRMGVNTLAFRAAQHGHFFVADPDIVAIVKNFPWELSQQWLRLVSQSGTALFTSIEPAILEDKHRKALRQALETASQPQPTAEPLDWMETDCPRQWKLMGKTVEFEWMGESGAWPFTD